MTIQRIRTAEQCAQEQLDAYNARDIMRFADVYSMDIQLIDLATGSVFCEGRTALIDRYGPMFAAHPDLHCRLMKRIVCPPFVFDEEDVVGLSPNGSTHAVATYECVGGMITRAWFVRELLA
ncbi:MAG: nuclear transport factor 2 family protein [Candidatus Kapabacteria bacterium]|nr:nuclear transport factor 2 family protein [Candidatus Kapabacteria bacterium]